jgi:membrane fusion protein, macrolide-specific efflux system
MPRLTLPRRLRRWPVVAVVVVLVLAGGGAAAYAMTRSSGSGSTTTLDTVKRTTYTTTVSASGTVEPRHEADLDFAVSGRVTAVKVSAGDTVTKGQVLAKVGDATLQANLASARATVTSAEDAVADDDSSSSSLASDEASLTAARSSLKSAEEDVDDASLRATISGTVTSVDLTAGQSVSGSGSSSGTSSAASTSAAGGSGSSSSSSSSGQVVIESTDTFTVDATVDDTDVKSVKKGQSVAITVDGATSTLSGTVSSVSTVPDSSSDTVAFPIEVAVSGHPSGVYAGSSATLSITTAQKRNIIEIPTQAITYSGSKATVTVDDNGNRSTKTITVGDTLGLETEVVSGLSVGEKVVVTQLSFGRGGFTRSGTGSGSGSRSGGEGGFGGGEGGVGGGSGGFGGSSGGFGGGSGSSGGFGGGGFGSSQ